MIHKFDEVDILFDPSWDNIAVSLSGGCDSALLTYQLCTLIKNTNVHIISHIRMWETRPWQSYYSKRVFDYFVNKFPDIKFIRHENFIPPELEGLTVRTDEYGVEKTGNQVTSRSYAEYICLTNNISAYYSGDTMNPIDVKGGPVDRNINGSALNTVTELLGGYACKPYSNVCKDYIISQYKKLNIWDLFELTRSCEGEFTDIDYKNYTPGQYVPVCNECFWCREREWGIEQNK